MVNFEGWFQVYFPCHLIQEIADEVDCFGFWYFGVLSGCTILFGGLLHGTEKQTWLWHSMAHSIGSDKSLSDINWSWPFSGVLKPPFTFFFLFILSFYHELLMDQAVTLHIFCFQYNCISLGFTVGAAAAILSQKDLIASALFCLALNHKQVKHNQIFF